MWIICKFLFFIGVLVYYWCIIINCVGPFCLFVSSDRYLFRDVDEVVRQSQEYYRNDDGQMDLDAGIYVQRHNANPNSQAIWGPV